MEIRPANTTTETRDAEGHVQKTVQEFNLGHWEMWKLQEAIALLPADARAHMEYFAHVIGSCQDVSVTITATYES